MIRNIGWSREQLLVAFKLYCQIPFGKMHSRNPEIIAYAELIGRTPSALAMKLTNIASLDPEITSSGRKGLSGASSADKAMWEEMQSNWENFAESTHEAEKELVQRSSVGWTAPESIKIEIDDVDYTGRNKVVQTIARIGQNFFRRAVLSAYDSKCCITGLSLPQLLVASHIVPWRIDPTNRLNPKNGLCLSILHDRAFDLGILTISENMTVLLSPRYSNCNDAFFRLALSSFEGKVIALPEKFAPHFEFLEYHRMHVFEG